MTNRLLNPQALEAHILHTVDSVPMLEIARRQDVEPSTILRQIRRVEDLRDNPEWGIILTKLTERWNRKEPIDRSVTYEALGVSTFDVTKEMQKAMLLLIQDDALVGITDGCMAGIFVDHEVMRRTDRMIALAWIASGWLILLQNSPRVRRYKLTDRAMTEVPETPIVTEAELPVLSKPEPKPAQPRRYTRQPRRYTRQPWGDEPIEKLRLMQRKSNTSLKVSNTDIQTAIEVRELMHLAKLEGKGSASLQLVVELQKALGDEMFDLLYAFLHNNHGLEQIEKDFSWPARSAKVVLTIALQQVRHFGVLESKEPAIAAE